MVSKESDYLIHLAEEQLKRLNESLCYYQRNTEIQDDFLECSTDRFCYEPTNLSLSPIYAIIDRQRQEAHSRCISGSSRDISPQRRKSKKIVNNPSQTHPGTIDLNDNHIRDWRHGVKLVRQTFGPRKQSPNKCNYTQSSLAANSRKEKLSTFWDYNGHKRTENISKSACNIEREERSAIKCCDRKQTYCRNEIRKYIRDKQRSYKDKECESKLKAKYRKEQTHSSLIKLNNPFNNDCKVIEVNHNDFFCHTLDKHRSSSSTNLRKSRLNPPIYDELRNGGILDYREYSRNDSPTRLKNGLNNTVDSGFETGEWLLNVTQDALRTLNDSSQDQISRLPTKSLRDNGRRTGTKSKTEYYNNLEKDYKDQISAYDAGSENEIYNDIGSPSPNSSRDIGQELIHQYVNPPGNVLDISEPFIQSKGNQRQLPIIDGKLSVSLPNCNVDFIQETSSKKSHGDYQSTESSQVCLIDELKKALIDAQMKLNPDSFDSNETVSERISQAVHNFIKTKALMSDPLDSLGSDTRPHSDQSTVIDEHSRVMPNKLSGSKKRTENKKDHLSTEFEATEIEYEHCKQVAKVVDINPTFVIRHEIRERIPEEKNSILVDSDQSEVIDDAMKDKFRANLATRTKDLQTRQDKANELITLTKEFKKESKRVKLLEKKACQFSKQYLQDPIIDKRNNELVDNSIHKMKNISLAKYPRHTIPPDGKDSGRSEPNGNAERQLSQRMAEMDIVGEDSTDGNYLMELVADNVSGLSDVEEPTASLSDVTTTLSDQSELEARLVALRAEMSKKHELVAKLKSRQKEMKRDKIKQKEIILQKQIDMYDDYILNLQSNIDQLSNKADDVVSDDSHTLTGSITNIHELESKTDEIDDIQPKITTDITFNDDHVVNEKDPTIDSMYTYCVKNYTDLGGVSIDKIVENNIEMAGENTNLDLMIEHKPMDRVTSPQDLFTPDNDGNILMDNGDQIKIEPTFVNDLVAISDDKEFNEIVQINSCSNFPFKDSDLDQLYTKEANFTMGDTNGQIILNELLLQNSKVFFQDDNVSYSVTIQNPPEIKGAHAESKERLENSERETELCPYDAETLKQDESDGSLDNKYHVIDEFDKFVPEIQSTVKCHSDQVKDDMLDFPINYSDDDFSSISHEKSVKFSDELFLGNDSEFQNVSKTTTEVIDESQVMSLNQLGMTSPIQEYKALSSNSISSVNKDSEYYVGNEILNLAKVEQLVECLLNVIVSSEIERMNLQCAKIDVTLPTVCLVTEIVDYQSTSFGAPQINVLFPAQEEKCQSSTVSSPEELMEYSSIIVEELPSVVNNQQQPLTNSANEDESVVKGSISTVDKQLLSDKIKWLIPLNTHHLETHIAAAILHFFQAKQAISQKTIDELLRDASDILPDFYIDNMSLVSDTEVGEALFDSLKQHSYIDKRIVFYLISEIFSEIYSFERYLPQMPWIHSSFMVKRKNYTAWKGDKPPETYDLVSKIIRERISQLFNQKNVFLNDITPKSTENCGHSKITKWCIERQKDKVDKILINDLRKEENEWVYYDEAEEEVKMQIADDIFNFLITDTISWLKSILSQN